MSKPWASQNIDCGAGFAITAKSCRSRAVGTAPRSPCSRGRAPEKVTTLCDGHMPSGSVPMERSDTSFGTAFEVDHAIHQCHCGRACPVQPLVGLSGCCAPGAGGTYVCEQWVPPVLSLSLIHI